MRWLTHWFSTDLYGALRHAMLRVLSQEVPYLFIVRRRSNLYHPKPVLQIPSYTHLVSYEETQKNAVKARSKRRFGSRSSQYRILVRELQPTVLIFLGLYRRYTGPMRSKHLS